MPKTVHLPSRGIDLSFPDAASDEQIVEAVNKYYPRNGQDVEYDISTGDPQARNELNVDDLRLYKAYKESQPSKGVGGWIDSIGAAVGSLADIAKKGVAGFIEEPGKAILSAVEGAVRGSYDLVGTLAQSTNPNSVLFGVKNALTNTGTEYEQLEQWKSALEWRDKRERIARGEETLLIPKEMVNTDQAELFSTGLDATTLIPGFGGLKMASLAEKALAKGLRGTGRVLSAADRALVAAEKRIGSVVEKATGLTPEAAASTARAVGLGSAAGMLDPMSFVGGGVARLATGPVGELLQATGEAMAKGPSRLTPLMQVAADEAISPTARTLANAASRLGGGLLLDVAPKTIGGLIEGAGIGTVLGALSAGEEGAAQGFGSGAASGAFGATVGRGFQYGLDALNKFKGMPFQSSLRNERVSGDWERTLRKMTPDQAQNAAAFAAAMADKGFDARALIADANDATGNIGTRMQFIREGDAPVDASGNPIPLENTKFQGVSIGRESGLDPVIFINVDRASKSTVPHEIIHAIRNSVVDETFVDRARVFLFGQDGAEISPELAGQEIQPAGVPKDTLTKFAEQYAAAGKNASDFTKAIEISYNPNAPIEARIKSQKLIADELLAYYAGFKVVGGLRGQYQDILLKGKLPSVISSLFDLARDATVQKLSRDGAFDFSQGVEQGFFKDGKQVKIKTMDAIVKDAFKAVRDGTLDPTEPSTVLNSSTLGKDGMERVNTIFGTKIFNTETGDVGEDIKPTWNKRNKPGKPAVDASGAPIPPPVADPRPISGPSKGKPTKPQTEFVKELLSTPGTPEEVAAGVGSFVSDKDGFSFPTGPNEAQTKKLADTLPPRQQRMLYQIRKDITTGINSLYNTTHAAETKKPKGFERGSGSASVRDSFIQISNRQVIPYGVFVNKFGDLNVRMLDIGLISERINSLLRDNRFKGAFDTGLDAVESMITTYFPNLAKGTEPSAVVLADKNGKWGDVRRNLFREAIKPPEPDVYINQPAEGYEVKRSDRSVFRTYSLRNILSMAPSGGSTSFDMKAYYKVKQNFMPSKVGEKDMFTNGDGVRVLEGDRGYRVYGPDGRLKGVYSDLESALKSGKNISVSYTPSEPEVSTEPVLSEVEKRTVDAYYERLKREDARLSDPTEAVRLQEYLSPEGIASRNERLASLASRRKMDFEVMLSRPVESLSPDRLASDLQAFNDAIDVSARQSLEAIFGKQESAAQSAAQSELERRTLDAYYERLKQEAQSKKGAERDRLKAEMDAVDKRRKQVFPPLKPSEPIPSSLDEIVARIIKSNKKPVFGFDISGSFAPAAKATERELQKR